MIDVGVTVEVSSSVLILFMKWREEKRV